MALATDDPRLSNEPAAPRSTILTPAEEAIIVEFRRRTLMPPDDVMGCLKDSIPNPTRSALHRCLQRHGISRLPASDDKTAKRGRFAVSGAAATSGSGRCRNRLGPGLTVGAGLFRVVA